MKGPNVIFLVKFIIGAPLKDGPYVDVDNPNFGTTIFSVKFNVVLVFPNILGCITVVCVSKKSFLDSLLLFPFGGKIKTSPTFHDEIL